MLATRLAPGLLDRYLARTGYDSQQTTQRQPPNAPSNLWVPADGHGGSDYGSHGRFDDRAAARSYQLWAARHHGILGAGITGVAALTGVALSRLRRAS